MIYSAKRKGRTSRVSELSQRFRWPVHATREIFQREPSSGWTFGPYQGGDIFAQTSQTKAWSILATMADVSLNDQLCTASAKGNLSDVLLMLNNGADVNGFNTFGRTALQVVKLGNTAVVEALLGNGADPNVRDPVLGLCVLHDAAREGFVDTVRVLLGHGADVNVADARGNLPLHLAAREGHLKVVELVIARTAEPRAANGLGLTAGQLARSRGKEDTAAYVDMYLNSH